MAPFGCRTRTRVVTSKVRHGDGSGSAASRVALPTRQSRGGHPGPVEEVPSIHSSYVTTEVVSGFQPDRQDAGSVQRGVEFTT